MFKFGESLPKSPVIKIKVYRQTERPKLSGRPAQKGHDSRIAEVEISIAEVEICAPKNVTNTDNIKLTLITCIETTKPKDDEPIKWYLLTTKKIKTYEDAYKCIKLYNKRWLIEDYHGVLKSGCNSKKLQHRSVKALERHIIINAIIAWRLMLITQSSEQLPERDPEILFSEKELYILKDKCKTIFKKDLENLRDAVRTVQAFGGYYNTYSKKKLEEDKYLNPGYEVTYNGYFKLMIKSASPLKIPKEIHQEPKYSIMKK